MRTFKWECAGFIGGEFDGNSVALFQKLVDVESLQLKSMIMVERRDDQANVVTLLDLDRAWIELVFLGGDLDLVWGYLRRGLQRGSGSRHQTCESDSECLHFFSPPKRVIQGKFETMACRNAAPTDSRRVLSFESSSGTIWSAAESSTPAGAAPGPILAACGAQTAARRRSGRPPGRLESDAAATSRARNQMPPCRNGSRKASAATRGGSARRRWKLRRIARGVRQRELRVTTKCPPPAGCRTEPRYGGPRRLIRLERYQRHNASPAACTIGGSTSPRLWRSGYPGMGRRSSETAP